MRESIQKIASPAVIGIILGCILWPLAAVAQHPPSIGYLFPPAGQAGQTVEVVLGGYDWTPDMQLFVRDERLKLEKIGTPGPIIVPEPPYWFGKKARRAPFGLPRETIARLTIPADVSAGVFKWQAANANGATASGRFAVTDLPIALDSNLPGKAHLELPICVCGQIKLISEVDRIDFVAPENGAIKCTLAAASIGSPLRAILEIRDATGKLVAEVADTAGADTQLAFEARAGQVYTAVVYDLDFRGDRSFVYMLTLAPEKQAVTAGDSIQQDAATSLVVPTEITRSLLRESGEDRFRVHGQVGEVWRISASGEKVGSQVDPIVTVFGSDGKELARVDDIAGSTDAELEFRLPAAGEYEIVVSDLSGSGGSSLANYAFSIRHAVPDFEMSAVERLSVPIGGKATLQLNVVRHGGFIDPIDVKLVGLPNGMTVPENLQVPAKQNILKVELEANGQAAAIADMVSILGQAVIDEEVIHRATDPVLVCTTIKPPFMIDAEGQDDVTKWPRGSTFPAPVLITRDAGFTGEILLEMTSMQGRHRQGIAGPDMRIRADVSRVLYPVFLPEWLETTRTSRMVVNGVAQVADPQGNLRYSVSRQKTRMGFLPTGAMLKISSDQAELAFDPKRPLLIPLKVSRDESLGQPVTLTLVSDQSESSPFSAVSQVFPDDADRYDFAIAVNLALVTKTEYPLKIRAAVIKDGQYPVISETSVIVVSANRGP
ncbi:MAG TPA: hypothetical protein DDZ51_19765 [Planctomycetaceae bacterium]|nr:hypothetical protein [Planctomycetaceae bacterium]